MSDTSRPPPPINSAAYWDRRFADDWDARGGPDQTKFFARLAIAHMPKWLKLDVRRRHLGIFDIGCAEGDAVPLLAKAFPRSTVSGGDVSAIAIKIARNRYPEFAFEVIAAEKPAVAADVIYCSNTIEHFENWRSKLDELASCAHHHVIVLAPFQ